MNSSVKIFYILFFREIESQRSEMSSVREEQQEIIRMCEGDPNFRSPEQIEALTLELEEITTLMTVVKSLVIDTK